MEEATEAERPHVQVLPLARANESCYLADDTCFPSTDGNSLATEQTSHRESEDA
jgi:hypothetical protein